MKETIIAPLFADFSGQDNRGNAFADDARQPKLT
jgi:hypothetical protein